MAFSPCGFTATVQNKVKITSDATAFRTCLRSQTLSNLKLLSQGGEKIQKPRARHTGAETRSANRAGGKPPGRTGQGEGAPLCGGGDAAGPPPANCLGTRARRGPARARHPTHHPGEASPGSQALSVGTPPAPPHPGTQGLGLQRTPGSAATCRPPVRFRSPREGRAAPHGGGRAGRGRRRLGRSSPCLTWRRPSQPEALPAADRRR